MKKITASLFVCLTLFAQNGLQNAIEYSWGVPCSYDIPATATSGGGTVACWGDADCYNGRPLVTNWSQDWSCSYSVVHAIGESYFVLAQYYIGVTPPIQYTYQAGVASFGSASIFDTFDGSFEKEYHGTWEEDCDSYVRHDDAYSYSC